MAYCLLLSGALQGFFLRAVGAVCFSFDAALLSAVSSDDHVSLGVWRVSSGGRQLHLATVLSLFCPLSPFLSFRFLPRPYSFAMCYVCYGTLYAMCGKSCWLRRLRAAASPPQVRCMSWAAGLGNARFLSRQLAGDDCDVFATAGERTLRVWALQRAAGTGAGGAGAGAALPIFFKQVTMGLPSQNKAKVVIGC